VFPPSIWKEERDSAADARVRDPEVCITGSDRDEAMVSAARANAEAAGVERLLHFHAAAASSFSPGTDFGCVICNPPYGERLGTEREAQDLARQLGRLRRTLATWSFFVLSARQDFPRWFGERASRNRKLYNGNLRCWLYQFFGPLR